ncbi:MAG: MBL fold metallo-hydrolase RNA specificity domain-containing protein [Candidatus Krumholzibacteriia bacterium]
MNIQFFGGAQTVTGSQHLLTINGQKILLECGLFQGRRKDTYEMNLNFEHNPAKVDAMLLSHAHIDHCGNIPNLYKNGYRGDIYTTAATADLCQIMLRDSAYLNQKDVEWVNQIRASRHEEPIEPLYSIEDTEEALRLFVGIQYHKPLTLAPGVTATFYDAGHILGSAGILLEIEENGKKTRLGFSGDVGRESVPILRDPQPLPDLDALIIESTYGDREHPEGSFCDQELADLVNTVHKRGGKLIIPAFAVGRTQLLVYTFHRLLEEERIPKIPIYVDSPMACNATDVFRAHPEVFDREAYDHFMNDEINPFAPEGFACIRSADASRKLNRIEDPQIIIAASGMMEGGRILHHLKHNIENPKNMLLFVGFAAEHTLARRLMEGAKKAKVFGEEYDVNAEVRIMPYFSGHADRHGLMKMATATPPDRLKTVFLVHGEKSQSFAFKDRLHAEGYKTVHVPERLASYTI